MLLSFPLVALPRRRRAAGAEVATAIAKRLARVALEYLMIESFPPAWKAAAGALLEDGELAVGVAATALTFTLADDLAWAPLAEHWSTHTECGRNARLSRVSCL